MLTTSQHITDKNCSSITLWLVGVQGGGLKAMFMPGCGHSLQVGTIPGRGSSAPNAAHPNCGGVGSRNSSQVHHESTLCWMLSIERCLYPR